MRIAQLLLSPKSHSHLRVRFGASGFFVLPVWVDFIGHQVCHKSLALPLARLSNDQWRDDAWEIMHSRPDVKFFLLTKRPDRVEIN